MEAIREAGREPIRDAYPEGRWLTYSELAEIRGIGRPSAVKLVKREGWRRIPGNDRDRTVRVLVPAEWLEPSKVAPIREAILDAIRDTIPELDAANARADAALALADRLGVQLADAGERVDEANKRADRAEARADQERLAADRFRGEAEAAEAERHRIAGELAQAEERRTAAEERAHHRGLELTAEKAMRSAADDEAARLRQAENERQQLGRWRRAWRGWRGR
jgi:hypothetical protein